MARTINARRRRGITLVEVLAATLLVSISVAGAVSLWICMATLTTGTSDGSTAVQLSKNVVEQIRMQGFTSAPEGTSIKYYNRAGASSSEATTRQSSSFYSVTTVVSTDKTQASTTGNRIAPLALRTVTVTVRRLSDSRVLESWGTFLARGGV